MSALSSGHLLTASIFLFLLSALLSFVFSKRQKAGIRLSNTVSMIASLAGFLSALNHLLSGGTAETIFTFQSAIPQVSISLQIDSLSSFFLLGLSVIAFCVSLYSIGYVTHYIGRHNVAILNFLFAGFIVSMQLVLTAGNAVFFLIAWELMSGISYFMVVYESDIEETRKAGTLYLIMTGIGTAFLMAAFMLMFAYTGSFEFTADASLIPPAARSLMFVFFLIGFGTKAGIIPLHIWLPAAHPAAPSNVSALMSGIMIKTAIYGLLRFVLLYLGVQNTWWGIVLLSIGIISAVLGVAYAFMEQNIKRLLAYSSIENIGIILIGIGVGLIALGQKNTLLASLALTASLFHAFNHTLFKSGLFMGAGALQFATHTKDMEKMGGLLKRMPYTALLMLCFSLAISALVPFNGFVGEWLAYQSLFMGFQPSHPGLNILYILSVAALALSGALAVACFTKLFGISFLGAPRTDAARHACEVPLSMRFAMGLQAIACLGIGLYPMALVKVIDKVTLGLGGMALAPQFEGSSLMPTLPLAIQGSSISPSTLLIALIGILLIAALMVRVIGGKHLARTYGTWDCGFEAINARMQYSATGFSKPLKIVFRILFRPSRVLRVEGKLPYHPETMEYTVTSESIFEKYLYSPLTGFFTALSNKTKDTIQTGSIRRYLAYIFLALVALMLYNIVI